MNNDGYSVLSENGKPLRYEIYATEKVYADFRLTTTNRGGHSSLPRPDNAIYALAAGLTRLAAHEFPFELNDVTRAYYQRMSGIEAGQRAADMRAITAARHRTRPPSTACHRIREINATMRTTCVATRLSGGHANNALPQEARPP